MIILALDTTSEWGSLTLRVDGRTVAETSIHAPEGFAHLIFGAIDDLLGQGAFRLAEIDCFAAAAGPGSFTGVRVGLSAVKGLADATGKPAVGVSNLRALSSFGNLPLRAVVLDARRGEVYAGIYNSGLEPVRPEAVLKLDFFLDSLEGNDYELIADPRLLPSLEASRASRLPLIEAPTSLAPAIALVAEQSPWLDPAALDANYVRRSDAELYWRDS